MKTIFTITIFFVLFSCSSCSTKHAKMSIKNDLSKEHIKGNVKRIKEISNFTIEKFGKIEKGDFFTSMKIEYDEEGDEIERISYNSVGIMDAKRIIKYDDNKNKIEQNWYKSDGSLENRRTYKNDDKGNIIEENYYESNGNLYGVFNYKYDNKGNKIEETLFTNGQFNNRFTFKYDNKENLIEKDAYTNHGKIDQINVYKYDENHNEIEESDYYSDGRLIKKFTSKYKYDLYGNWIKMINQSTIDEREIEYY